jgi:hypothetical protein
MFCDHPSKGVFLAESFNASEPREVFPQRRKLFSLGSRWVEVGSLGGGIAPTFPEICCNGWFNGMFIIYLWEIPYKILDCNLIIFG